MLMSNYLYIHAKLYVAIVYDQLVIKGFCVDLFMVI